MRAAFALLPLACVACIACARASAPEIQTARDAVAKASADVVTDPTGLDEARSELARAVAIDRRHPGAIEARDRAYIATLRAMRAEVDGRAAKAEEVLERKSQLDIEAKAKRVTDGR